MPVVYATIVHQKHVTAGVTSCKLKALLDVTDSLKRAINQRLALYACIVSEGAFELAEPCAMHTYLDIVAYSL